MWNPTAVVLEHVLDMLEYLQNILNLVSTKIYYQVQYSSTAVSVSLSSIMIMKPEVHWNLWKSNIRKRHNVSFVGLSGFYSIFQHTDGKRPHSMACRGQHGWEFTEPEMIAKIIRIGSSRRVTLFDWCVMTQAHAWPCPWPGCSSDPIQPLGSTRVLCIHICSMLADIVQRVYILKYLLWFGAFLLGWNEGGGAHSLYFSNFLGKTRPLSMSTQK